MHTEHGMGKPGICGVDGKYYVCAVGPVLNIGVILNTAGDHKDYKKGKVLFFVKIHEK